MWASLPETAVKFSTPGEAVSVSSFVAGDVRQLKIQASSMGIRSSALPVFFDLFSITAVLTPRGARGVGPALACRIVALYAGSVDIENCERSRVISEISLKPRANQ
jgi:K+-sensing histidine kinase KdpD